MSLELFYLHGMGGSPRDWQWVAPLQPGEALSIPVGAGNVTRCAALLARDISRRAKGNYALCGYSMGGRLALLATELLLLTGRPPSKLVLLSTGFGSSSEEERVKRNRVDEQWGQLAKEQPEKFWEQWYKQELFLSFHALPEEQKQAWLASRKSIDIESLVRQLRELGPSRHGGLFPLLKGIVEKGISVLYIVGEQDKKYLELARKVQKEQETKGLRVETIPGVGHILPLEAPEQIATSLRAFLDE